MKNYLFLFTLVLSAGISSGLSARTIDTEDPRYLKLQGLELSKEMNTTNCYNKKKELKNAFKNKEIKKKEYKRSKKELKKNCKELAQYIKRQKIEVLRSMLPENE